MTDLQRFDLETALRDVEDALAAVIKGHVGKMEVDLIAWLSEAKLKIASTLKLSPTAEEMKKAVTPRRKDDEVLAIEVLAWFRFFGIQPIRVGEMIRYPKWETDAMGVVINGLSTWQRDYLRLAVVRDVRDHAADDGANEDFELPADWTEPPELSEIKRQALAHYRRVMEQPRLEGR